MKKLAFLVCILGAIGNVAAQKSLPLEECVDLAWKNNLQLKQAELDIQAGENELQNSKAGRLPNLNGFANHNYNWGQRIDPFTNQFANTRVQSNSFGLSSSIVLFNGFQNEQNIKSQQASLQSIIYDVQAQKNDVALAVASAYLSVLLSDELINVAETQEQISLQQLERIQKLVAAGSVNIGVQYDLEAQLAADVSNRVQRQNEYRLALLQLKQLLMIPADEALSLEKTTTESTDESVLVSVPSIYAQAEQNMPEIKRAELSISQWENQIKVSQSGYYPSLSLSGSIGTGYSGLRTEPISVLPGPAQEIGATASGELVYAPTFDTEVQRVAFGTQLNDNFNQFVGLSLNVPIFNRGGVYTSVQRSKINQERAEVQLEAEKQALRQRIESAHADAIAAKQTVLANQKSVEATTKAFEFAEVRFENGALNVNDFNNSKNNLRAAEARLSRARFDYLFKAMVLEFFLGKPISLQ